MNVKWWWIGALCGAALIRPAVAQEPTPEPKPAESAEAPKETPPEKKPEEAKVKRGFDDPPLHRWGGLALSALVWQPPASGADYEVATRFRGTDQGLNSVFTIPNTGSVSDGYRAMWTLPHQLGALDFGYDALKNESTLERLDPGTFLYGETLVLPTFAGIADDGFADGFRALSTTKTRRFRVEYAHTAFESPRVKGTWHAGLRYLGHARDVRTTYFAIAPNLPPLLPPSNANSNNITPRPDFAESQSDFSGNGVGAGLDLQFHVHPRVDIVGGLSVGVVPGQQKVQYRSLTHVYFFEDPNPLGGVDFFPTYSELLAILADPVAAQGIRQFDATASLTERHSEQIAQDFEAYFGVEGKLWKTLRLFLHLRALEVVNAGAELRPTSATIAVGGTGFVYAVTGFDRTSRSVGYQGFVVGASYRF